MKDDWALCVGVGKYDPASNLVDLPGAINDATEIHDWLVDPLGGDVPTTQAELVHSKLASSSTPFPVTAEIEKFLKLRIADAAKSKAAGNGFRTGNRLWLFFAGHGIGFSVTRFPNEAGLLTADAVPPFLPEHIPGLMWAEKFQQSGAFKEVILLVDCCRTTMNGISPSAPGVNVFTLPSQSDWGKLVVAFGASQGNAAYSVMHQGKERGRFTLDVENILKDPTLRPLKASDFADQIADANPNYFADAKRGLHFDFALLGSTENTLESVSAENSDETEIDTVIAHGETSVGYAIPIADELTFSGRRAVAEHTDSIPTGSSAPAGSPTVENLVVIRDMPPSAMKNLYERVRPKKAVFYTENDPGLGNREDFLFIQRGPLEKEDLTAAAERISEYLAVTNAGKLSVSAQQHLAQISVRNAKGRQVARQVGSIESLELSSGTYSVNAAIGPYTLREEGVEIEKGKTTKVEFPTIKLPEISKENRIEWNFVSAKELIDSKSLVEETHFKGRVRTCPIGAESIQMCLSENTIPGYRFEAFWMSEEGTPDISIRLVPQHMEEGAPNEADDIREQLRLGMMKNDFQLGELTVDDLHGDPVSLLFATAISLRSSGKEANKSFLDAAADKFGKDHPDIQLLGKKPDAISVPPLLSYAWHWHNTKDSLTVVKNSLADSLAGRLLSPGPWFAWAAKS